MFISRVSFYTCTVSVILCFAVCTHLSADAGDLQFDINDLKVEGVVTGVLTGDLDGDGRIDILVMHKSGMLLDVRQYLSVFYQWENGIFSTAADLSWETDSLVEGIALETAAGGGPSPILYLRKDGVIRYEIGDEAVDENPRRIIDHRTFFVSGNAERLTPVESFCEPDSAGVRWITLPAIERIVMFKETGAGMYEPVDSIGYRLKTRVTTLEDDYVANGAQRLRQTLTMPTISRASLRGRTGRDFIIMYEGSVEGYLWDDGGFSPSPDVGFDYNLAMDIASQNDGYLVRPALHDLNGDGYSDLVVMRQESEGLSGFKTVLDFYYGPLTGPEGGVPSQQMVFDDAISFFISFIDLEDDGDLELAVPVVKLGIFDIIRILTTRSIKVTVDVYKLGEDGLYGRSPRYVHEIKAGLDLKAGGSGEIIGKVVNLNGDRFKDLIISLKPDRLSLFLGEGGSDTRFFEKRQSTTLECFPDVEIKAIDLTENNLDDLIATFGNDKKGAGLVRLFINRTPIK